MDRNQFIRTSPEVVHIRILTVLSTSFRKSFFAWRFTQKSKFANFVHDLMQNYLSQLPMHKKVLF